MVEFERSLVLQALEHSKNNPYRGFVGYPTKISPQEVDERVKFVVGRDQFHEAANEFNSNIEFKGFKSIRDANASVVMVPRRIGYPGYVVVYPRDKKRGVVSTAAHESMHVADLMTYHLKEFNSRSLEFSSSRTNLQLTGLLVAGAIGSIITDSYEPFIATGIVTGGLVVVDHVNSMRYNNTETESRARNFGRMMQNRWGKTYDW